MAEGDVFTQTKNFVIKCDSGRCVYVKKVDDKQFTSADFKVPIGMTRDQKQIYLEKLGEGMEKRYESVKIEKENPDVDKE